MLTSETIELDQQRFVVPIFLTATDTAIALAADAQEVDDLIAAGEIQAVKLNGRIRVSYDSLRAYHNRKVQEQQ